LVNGEYTDYADCTAGEMKTGSALMIFPMGIMILLRSRVILLDAFEEEFCLISLMILDGFRPHVPFL
jgi:hypothetical protein